MKAHQLNKVFFLAVVVFTAVSCNQAPIFYTISTETVPQPPLISGAPTKMIEFGQQIYVASDKLYWYAKDQDGTAKWDLTKNTIEQPSGKIIDLAATKSHLYALCLNDSGLDSTLWRIGQSGNTWEEISYGNDQYPLIQSIYADPEKDRLFAAAGKDDKEKETYAILCLNNNALKMIKDDVKILSGVVFRDDIYYISTQGAGIFQATDDQLTAGTISQLRDNSNISAEDKNNDRLFMGIIKLKDPKQTIIAIERYLGALHEVQDGMFREIRYTGGEDAGEVMSTDRYATGALALWENAGIKMLIAGKQGGLYNTTTSSYTHGYVEFRLTGNGSLDTSVFRRDPGNLASVVDQDRYRATLGKHPINYLFQAPAHIDRNMTFFASTQNAGLWSYKNRPDDGGWQWNAEN
jgi:hypothetical protein